MHRTIGPAAALLALLALSSGCTAVAGRGIEKRIPPAPSAQWQPKTPLPARTDTAAAQSKNLPPELLGRQWTLTDIVDVALLNNPLTRASWQSARAGAARYGSERGSWLPRLDGSTDYSRSRGTVGGGRLNYKSISYGAGVSLNYILFNFGKRIADVEVERQEMISRNWLHNATVQNVILAVQEEYYNYLYAKATRQARQAALEEARRNLDAAEVRRQAGLATIADVLQARTRCSQAELNLVDVEGRIQTIRGSLATAMGLPADIEYDIDYLPDEIPADSVSGTVDRYIDEALSHRPDLAAARSQALKSEAELTSTRAEGYPSFALRAGSSRVYYNSQDRKGDLYNFGVTMSVPLFTGFSHGNDILESKAKAEKAREDYRRTEQQVTLDVWTSYYDLKTSVKRLSASRDLLQSATRSHQVAEERYRAGVGGILELLQAQADLEDARASDIAARTDWLISLARLAHDTGVLGLSNSNVVPAGTGTLNEGMK